MPTVFARLGAKRELMEKQINERLKLVLQQFTDDWYPVTLAPAVAPRPEWREARGSVSRETRQNIIDGLKIDQVPWNGRLEEVEFLERLFDLRALPSHDSRFKNAAADIWQHRVNNPGDWSDDWIYDDARFNLMKGPRTCFCGFCASWSTRSCGPTATKPLKLVQQFNDQLRLEGWRLVEQEKIAGRPRFVAERIHLAGARSVSRARTVADALNAGWMQKEIERLENAVDRDPALAIGTAKELVDSCCKSILAKRGVEVSRKADLPELTKQLARELRLVPEGISDEAKGAETFG